MLTEKKIVYASRLPVGGVGGRIGRNSDSNKLQQVGSAVLSIEYLSNQSQTELSQAKLGIAPFSEN